jgi:hypothetical protein
VSAPVDNYLLSRLLSGHGDRPSLDAFSPADWEALLQRAQAEGVAPMLYWSLWQSGSIYTVPDNTALTLRAMFAATALNNEQLMGELMALGDALARAGMPVIALKGVCFALTIYPDLGLRPMVDIDLLVPALRGAEALQLAESRGYAAAIPEASPGLNDILSHAACLKKTAAPYTTLELHTTLVAEQGFAHAVPVDWFWSQTEPLKFHNLMMLSPTAQLLYACAHAMLQHGGRNTSLRWLYDLHRLVEVYGEQGRIDWKLLLRQARQFHWSSSLAAALSQAADYFVTPVPQDVLDYLARHPDRNTDRVAAMQRQPATHTLEEIQKLRSLNGLARLKLLLALVIPSPAYIRWRYGFSSPLALPGWYLHRWRVIIEDALQTVRFLRQERSAKRLEDQGNSSTSDFSER